MSMPAQQLQGSGGGQPSSTEQVMGMLNGGGQGPVAPTPPAQQTQPAQQQPAPQQQPGQQQGDSLVNEFLKSIPEAHRPFVAPYVSQWDAQVTRKFQELHNQLRPYQELGMPPEELQNALTVYKLLEEQPEVVYQILQQEYSQGQPQLQAQPYPSPPNMTGNGFIGAPPQPSPTGGAGWSPQVPQAPQQGAPFTPFGAPQFPAGQQPGISGSPPAGLPPELMQRIDRQERLLSSMAELLVAQRKASQEAEEDKALDAELGRLKEQYGEYDQNYILMLMEQGIAGDDAVKQWQQTIQQFSRQQQAPQPPILSGGGVIPSEQFQPSRLDQKQTRGLVAGLLQQVAQEGR